MPGKIIKINEEEVKAHLGNFVRETVEETLNAMLEAEAEQLVNAQKHERNTERKGYRTGHYERKLLTKAGVSVRQVEDITEALWGAKVSPGTISNLNKKIYEEIEKWRNLPLKSHYTYVYLDGIWMKRSWAGEVRNVSVLVAIGVNEDGFREIIGVAEGTKEDKDSWRSCFVHFYRNVFSFIPHGKVKEIATMLKAIHAQENREEAIRKKDQIARKPVDMKPHKATAFLIRKKIWFHSWILQIKAKGNCERYLTLPRRRPYRTRAEARSEIFDYIEVLYNRKRCHKHLNHVSPVEFERQLMAV